MEKSAEWKELDRLEMGSRIRERRDALGWSREKLAAEMDVSATFIAALECGNKGIKIENLYKLAQILGISADYLLAGQSFGNTGDPAWEKKIEDILEPLKNCTVGQLEHTEKMIKLYTEALKEK